MEVLTDGAIHGAEGEVWPPENLRDSMQMECVYSPPIIVKDLKNNFLGVITFTSAVALNLSY